MSDKDDKLEDNSLSAPFDVSAGSVTHNVAKAKPATIHHNPEAMRVTVKGEGSLRQTDIAQAGKLMEKMRRKAKSGTSWTFRADID